MATDNEWTYDQFGLIIDRFPKIRDRKKYSEREEGLTTTSGIMNTSNTHGEDLEAETNLDEKVGEKESIYNQRNRSNGVQEKLRILLKNHKLDEEMIERIVAEF